MAQKEINIKVKTDTSEVTESVKSLKQQFREAQLEAQKLAAADVVDQKALDAAIAKTAELKDRMNDVNEQIGVLTAGSPFEKMANGLGDVGSKIASLDFEGAKESAGRLIQISKSITFGEAIKSVKDLGSTFLQLGRALLTNPLFLIGAAIALLVMGIIKLLDKLGLLKVITKAIGEVFDWLMIPINAIIDGLKALTDWFGWTNNAATDAAKQMAENAEKTAAAYEEKSKTVIQGLDNEIRMAELNGESTRKAELKKAYWILNTAKQRAKADIAAYQSAKLQGDLDEEELKALEDKYKASKLAAEQAGSDVKYLKAKFRKEDADAEKKANEEAQKANDERNKKIADANKKAADERKKRREEEAKARLEAKRYLTDLLLQNMEDGVEKEIAINNEKYKRLLEANKNNALITAEQRKAIAEQLEKQQSIEEGKIKDADNQKKLDAEKSFQEELKALKIAAGQTEQEALKTKYDDDLSALQEKLANELYTEEQYQQLKAQLDANFKADKEKLDAAEKEAQDQKYLDELAKNADTFKERLTLLEEEKRIKLENTKLTEEEKLAIEAEYSEKRKKMVLDEVAATAGYTTQGLNAIQSLSDSIFAIKMSKLEKGSAAEEKAARKQFEINKKLQIAQAIVQGVQAVLAAYSSGSAIPVVGAVTGPLFAGIAAIATAANIAKIKNSKFEGGGGPTPPPPPPDVTSSVTAATPQFNLFGTPNQGNNATGTKSAEATTPTINVNASVSVDEITDTQNKVAKVSESATL